MKASALYFEAARIAEEDRYCTWCLPAIAWAARDMRHETRMRFLLRFSRYFKPEDTFSHSDWDSFGNRNERVLALLFMSAMAEK